MKQTFGKILLAVAALTLGSGALADEAELEAVQAKISSLFPEIGAEHVFASPIDGWYTIRKGAIVAYVSADGRYLMQGDLIDLERQANLTEESRNVARKELMASYPEEQMIVFTPAEKRFTVSVFTDIDCTYCRRLHAQIDEYLAHGIEINYLLYPRNGPTSPSWVKAEQVWCADDRGEALTLAKIDKAFETHSCDSSAVSKHYSVGRDVGLRGTPAIVLPDGTMMPGYLPPNQLLERLAADESMAATR